MVGGHGRRRVLIIKTGALGDVLRTTSIVAGLLERFGPELELTWVTAYEARPLLEGLVGRGVSELLVIDPSDGEEVARLGESLREQSFDQVLSFDDETHLCALATEAAGGRIEQCVVGAYLADNGQRTYTKAAAAWFDMGLLSRFGKPAADQLKVENTRSHPAIFAEMLGIEPGEPRLELPPEALAAARERLGTHPPLQIGLNTGAGGRWRSKALPEERVVELAVELDRRYRETGLARPRFVLLGGPEERERNERLLGALAEGRSLEVFDAGCDNSLVDFAALIDGLDLVVTSDSLALHMATARSVPVVAFFAPTSAAEIELYGRGQKVISTSPDYCSYARNADTATLTVERLAEAVMATTSRI